MEAPYANRTRPLADGTSSYEISTVYTLRNDEEYLEEALSSSTSKESFSSKALSKTLPYLRDRTGNYSRMCSGAYANR
jgi:hypothetical protein